MKLLSKSKYLTGLQCPKLLWIEINDPTRLPVTDPTTQFIFDQGHLVGELARKLFPSGIDIPTDDFFGNIKETKKLLEKRETLFEAGMLSGQLYSRLDILRPADNDSWHIIEVKSSTSIKDINIHDVAFQRHCCERQGLNISKCYLAYINNKYVRAGEIDLEGLFIVEDITDQVSEVSIDMQDKIEDMLEVISRYSCPEMGIGPHCRDPYECVLAECWGLLPEDNIFNLYRGGKKHFELYDKGITTIKDIPDSYRLNEKQCIQRNCEIDGQPYVNKEAITNFLATLQYPLYYLDFETISPAVPLFDGTRPYQPVPFQFSCHVVKNEKALSEHFSFLVDCPDDPRPAFLSELKKVLGDYGSIVVYNQGFEEGILKEVALVFPEYYDWVNHVRSRMVDLLQPFRSFSYYHPQQKGSASLKAVLPAITGKGYEDLEINDGQIASIKFLAATYGEMPEAEREKVMVDLKEYCGRDTEGMIWIIDKLTGLCD